MKKAILTCTLFLCAIPLFAQRWEWPDHPKNLTALPKTTTGRELQRTMFSFTSGLHVRCTYCHIGEEGKDFSEYDFVSDESRKKTKPVR